MLNSTQLYLTILVIFFTSLKGFAQTESVNVNSNRISPKSDNVSVIMDTISDNIDSIPVRTYLTQEQWVDSVFNSLTEEERIAQLIMIRAHSNKTRQYHEKIANTIRNQKVGGLCFFQGGPIRQINLINYYQDISKAPLLIAIDGEWGVSMRLDSAIKFPRQMTLGAIQNDSLIYEMGQEVAIQCKAVGVDMNFAPVADVNNNPKNPVINSRSFGENPLKVGNKSSMYMKGMQSKSLLTCAKHFPGHGDTDSDSHKTLPTVAANMHDLDSIHFTPFKMLFDEGIASVMIAHLSIPNLDNTKNLASTLSPVIVDSLLRRTFNFKGLAITDALEMKGVSNYFKPGELEVKALAAGNDILLMPHDAAISVSAIHAAIKNNTLDSANIYNRVKKVLKYKYIAGLYKDRNLTSDSVYEILNSTKSQALTKQLYRNALTLIKGDSLLPLSTNLEKSFAIVSVGTSRNNAFTKTTKKYRKADLFSIKRKASVQQVNDLAAKLQKYDYVIIGLFNTNNSPSRNYGVYNSTLKLANSINPNSKLIIDMHANPYAAKLFIDSTKFDAFMISYQDNNLALEAAAEALFGGSIISGRLPVSINDSIKAGFGLDTKKKRLSFGKSEEIRIGSNQLFKIDSIIKDGVNKGAYPGCQVLIAKDGFVFFDRNYGSYTYKNNISISDSSIYDLASVTKVMATTMSLMQLVKENKIDVDQRLSYYLPGLDTTDKGNLLIRDVLAHQAQLHPWIPFYLHSMKDGKLDSNLYRNSPEEGFTTKVSDSIYILDTYGDSMMVEIANSKLRKRKKYKYSDLGMYYMRRIIEKQSGEEIENYVQKHIYKPLGLSSTTYVPSEKFPIEQIVPTEEDNYFRFCKAQGYVHDQACAMEGGIEGHAGLFSNSMDIAILSQMLLQKGIYGNDTIINPEVLDEFTHQQFPLNHNRRGLGFDKPVPNHRNIGPTTNLVSPKSFGHSGFTGTYFWVDPESQLIYIFLSNRTYPTAENKKLITMNIRTKIQEEIYRLFLSEETIKEINK